MFETLKCQSLPNLQKHRINSWMYSFMSPYCVARWSFLQNDSGILIDQFEHRCSSPCKAALGAEVQLEQTSTDDPDLLPVRR